MSMMREEGDAFVNPNYLLRILAYLIDYF